MSLLAPSSQTWQHLNDVTSFSKALNLWGPQIGSGLESLGPLCSLKRGMRRGEERSASEGEGEELIGVESVRGEGEKQCCDRLF